jgi:hypothetical protein
LRQARGGKKPIFRTAVKNFAVISSDRLEANALGRSGLPGIPWIGIQIGEFSGPMLPPFLPTVGGKDSLRRE